MTRKRLTEDTNFAKGEVVREEPLVPARSLLLPSSKCKLARNLLKASSRRRPKTENRSGQAAVEYLVLTGFMMLILSVLLVASYTKVGQSEKRLDIDAAERAANELKRAADFVYIHGDPTKLTVSVYLPHDIYPEHCYIGEAGNGSGNTINIAMGAWGSYTDVWRRTRGTVTGDMPVTEGYYVFVVQSTEGGDIEISY